MAEKKPKPQKNIFQSSLDWFLRRPESGIVLILVLFVTVVTIINPRFLALTNVANILHSAGFIMICVVGMAMVLIIGGLDLSIGSIYALSALICGLAMTQWGLPIPVAILMGLMTGCLCGVINGFLIVRTGIPPMIVTLGMQYALRGVLSVLTKGVPIYPLPDGFTAIDALRIFPDSNGKGGIQIVIILAAVLIAIMGHIILSKTYFGRSIYALGGNQDAARISGINIGRTKMIVYILMGITSALAGIMMSSRLGSVEPSTGAGLELKVICGAIIGGISITGGMGTMFGAALGAVFMEALTNSLTTMRVSVYWQNLVFGIAMILSVLLDQYKRSLIKRRSIRSTEIKKTAPQKQ